jgi:hypothetical protein
VPHVNRWIKWSCLFVTGALTVTDHSFGEQAHRVRVAIITQESTVHTSVGNRDAYVVRVQPKSGNSFVARIVDSYPGYSDAVVVTAAKDDARISVALRRAPYCDTERTGTDGADEMRCFEVVHGSWRLPKVDKDEWWK